MAHPTSKPITNRTVRLAESESMAVDLCPCGTLQLHLGALSLRFHADSAVRLAQILGAALASREALIASADEPQPIGMNWSRTGRAHGDA